MRRLATVSAAVLTLSACVSTQMKQLIGQDVAEAEIRHGSPTKIIELSDGRRAFQFLSGGGLMPVPGSNTTTVTNQGPVTRIQSTGTPPAVIETPPCTLTYVARAQGSRWIIESIRVPKQLVC